MSQINTKSLKQAEERVLSAVGGKTPENVKISTNVAELFLGILDLMSAIPFTTQELSDAIEEGGLTPGQWYRVSDYAPDTFLVGEVSVTNPSPLSFDLAVQAIAPDTLNRKAFLLENASTPATLNLKNYEAEIDFRADVTEVVKYDWIPSDYTGFVITRLTDVLNKVSAPFDFLNVLVPRYAAADAEIPNWVEDPGGTSVLANVPAFSKYSYEDVGEGVYELLVTNACVGESKAQNCYIGDVVSKETLEDESIVEVRRFPDVVLFGPDSGVAPSDIILKDGVTISTICGKQVTVGEGSSDIITGLKCESLVIGTGVSEIRLFPRYAMAGHADYKNCVRLKIGDFSHGVVFGGVADVSLTDQNVHEDILVEENCSDLSIAAYCSRVRIGINNKNYQICTGVHDITFEDNFVLAVSEDIFFGDFSPLETLVVSSDTDTYAAVACRVSHRLISATDVINVKALALNGKYYDFVRDADNSDFDQI